MKNISERINEGRGVWQARVQIDSEKEFDVLDYIIELAENDKEIYKKFDKASVDAVINHLAFASKYPTKQ